MSTGWQTFYDKIDSSESPKEKAYKPFVHLWEVVSDTTLTFVYDYTRNLVKLRYEGEVWHSRECNCWGTEDELQ